MNYIELFAGCGGLSIGMKSEGFKLVIANEISPMASETFSYNLLKEDLNFLDKIKHTFWIKSKYKKDNILRLREDYRRTENEDGTFYSDISKLKSYSKLKESMLVGSILDLNKSISDTPELCEAISTSFGKGRVDLISGGSPCQSFSMAGLRNHDSDKNKLPWAFVEFVNMIKPRMVLLENVTGILRAFKVDDEPRYAWFEVAKAFASGDYPYVPVCLHINAKFVGVAQNRPRFIMLAFEKDLANQILKSKKLGQIGKEVFSRSIKFADRIQKGEDVDYEADFYYDLNNDHSLFDEYPFNVLNGGKLSTVKDAIDDLQGFTKATEPSPYVTKINKLSSSLKTLSKYDKDDDLPSNHDACSNGMLVKCRFRLYQIMSKMEDREILNNLKKFLKDPDENPLLDATFQYLKIRTLFTFDGSYCSFGTKPSLKSFLTLLKTKKQTQRALIPDKPAPAALSIPDDACHYDEGQLRTLTVREMARIQSFPDAFEFRSKITTGGQMRQFEVPQYTQVGNAVPPMLGKALGKLCKQLLTIE